MFLIRRAKIDDIPTLLKLARMVHFINLPADKDILADKVMRSRESFLKAAAVRGGSVPAGQASAEVGGGEGSGLAELTVQSDLFMLVLEDAQSGGVLGTSQVISHMGGPGHPNLSFQLSRREFFSNTLKQGGTHVVAKLLLDESGPTEIGGLILQPSYRNHRLKLGRLLSFVRFHIMGMYRPMFAPRVLAEMMGPMTPDGRSTLWEYLGRRFINLTYPEADGFCQYSKEFMTSLLPREEIYLTLLPPEARSVVGQVGPETVPARKMLERLGFAYRDCIDPFDGGPNLEAQTDAIPIVNDTRPTVMGEAATAAELGKAAHHGIVSVLDGDGEFRAVETDWMQDRAGKIRITKAAMKLLAVSAGVECGVTPISPPIPRPGLNGKHAGAKRTKSPAK